MRWSYTEDEIPTIPPRSDHPRRFAASNSAMLLDGNGQVLGVADKIKMMIFSEGLPGGRWIFRNLGINLYRLLPVLGDFEPGKAPTVLELPRENRQNARLGIMICYEDLFPNFGRDLHQSNPNILINLTNEAWFGATSEPEHHLALATMRAIEQRVSLLRSTNTGISAFVTPTGKVSLQTNIDEQIAVHQEVPLLSSSRTLFMILGNWPSYLAIAFWLIIMILKKTRTKRNSNELEQA